MNVKDIKLEGMRILEGTHTQLEEVKSAIEQKINLSDYTDTVRPIVLNFTTVMRICLLVGLSDKAIRSKEKVEELQTSAGMQPLGGSFFTKSNIKEVFVALIKMRYCDIDADWQNSTFLSKVLYSEMMRGKDILMQEGGIDEWLHYSPLRGGKSLTDIPELNLYIGQYEDGMDAALDINSTAIANTQILVAGTTGSGKSNLLAVLINQIRMASADTYYPVNFLLFDYKGEFSDPAHADWLSKFATDSSAILNPMEKPLPFTPFKDFTGRPVNEIHLYSTSLANAICSISSARIGALMDNRLSEAIINAYKAKGQKPITFQEVLDHYTLLMPEKKRDDMDSVKSVLSQLIRNNIFAEEDKIDLMKGCYIINLGQFDKEGIMAKAIVYFVTSKLNSIYDQLPPQAVSEERVELRHFTVIDEAHYMLGFENKPLQHLIAVGRNKGMSIILATQNMESFKSRHFDFYANAQYPLIMKQQQQNDGVLKDLFGVGGSALQELKEAIAGLQKGELITKDAQAMALGIGKHWKKIKVTHLI